MNEASGNSIINNFKNKNIAIYDSKLNTHLEGSFKKEFEDSITIQENIYLIIYYVVRVCKCVLKNSLPRISNIELVKYDDSSINIFINFDAYTARNLSNRSHEKYLTFVGIIFDYNKQNKEMLSSFLLDPEVLQDITINKIAVLNDSPTSKPNIKENVPLSELQDSLCDSLGLVKI